MALALVQYVGRRALARLSRGFHHHKHESGESEGDNCLICQEPPTDPACLPCMHVFCHDCLNNYALQRDMSAHEFIVQHILCICIICCPTCRTPIHKKSGERLTFPKPKTCGDCGKPIKKAFIFPQCDHVNENRCIACIESYEGKGNVRCPTCLSACERGILRDAYLCSTCEKFSTETVCKRCLENMLSPKRTPQETRQYASSQCSTTFVIVVAVAMLIFVVTDTPSPSPPISRYCFRRGPWFVDMNGRVFCEDQFLSMTIQRNSSEKNIGKNSNKRSEHEMDDLRKLGEKNLIPENQKKKIAAGRDMAHFLD